MSVTVDQAGTRVELFVWPANTAGLSVDLSPAEWCALAVRAEELPCVVEYRRQRSVEAAREAQSHGASRG